MTRECRSADHVRMLLIMRMYDILLTAVQLYARRLHREIHARLISDQYFILSTHRVDAVSVRLLVLLSFSLIYID